MSQEESPLSSWKALCEALKNADETYCLELFQQEEKGNCRPSFMRRIYGRLLKLQSNRKRNELENKL